MGKAFGWGLGLGMQDMLGWGCGVGNVEQGVGLGGLATNVPWYFLPWASM